MTAAEMLRRLANIPEAARLSMYRDACDGFSGYAVAGYDRANMKASNAVFEWVSRNGNIAPTDQEIAQTKIMARA